MIGHTIAAVIFGALAQIAPDKVLSDSGSPCPRVVFTGIGADGRRYGAAMTLSGGMGAQSARDGLSAAPFPSNAGGTSVEIIEAVTPLVFHRRELVPDSGGPGRHRGGLGVALDVQLLADAPCTVSMMTDRIDHPPLGRDGALPGAPNVVRKSDGRAVHPKARTPLLPGETLEIRTAGGGGCGPTSERDPAAVEHDIAFGYVTPEAAATRYGRRVEP
jgi:N-methylhydantoinase B